MAIGRIREHGVIVKRKCRSCLRIALLYPSVYRAAVASLAYQNMYYFLNSLDFVVAERFVAKNISGEEPEPRSLETGSPLTSFDAVLVPIGFEADYAGLVRLLAAAGIEPRREKRGRGPLLVLGGPVPSVNPSIASGFADVVLLGDAEPLLPLLVEALYDEGERGLERLGCRDGFLSGECSRGVRVVVAPSIEELPHSVTQFRVPGSGDPWGEAYMVEISRGCPHMCRFCMPAHFSMPFRVRSFARVVELLENGVRANSVKRVAFYSLSFFDHPASDRLLEYIVEAGLEASIGSLRGDQLDDARVELLRAVGQRVVTIAPETLSPRLCSIIGKCIPVERVEEVARAAWNAGMHVKVYLMVGLPGETLDDVERTARALAAIARKQPRRRGMRVSVNPLIPKPWTPMQYASFISEKEYYSRIRVLRKVLSRVGVEVDALSYRYALAEAIIARGNRELVEPIIDWGMVGARLGSFFTALKKRGVELSGFLRFDPERAEWLRMVRLAFPLKSLEVSWSSMVGG